MRLPGKPRKSRAQAVHELVGCTTEPSTLFSLLRCIPWLGRRDSYSKYSVFAIGPPRQPGKPCCREFSIDGIPISLQFIEQSHAVGVIETQKRADIA